MNSSHGVGTLPSPVTPGQEAGGGCHDLPVSPGLCVALCQACASHQRLQPCCNVGVWSAGYSWPPRAAAETWHLGSCSHTRMLGSEFPVTVSKLGSLAIPDPHLLEFSGEQSLQTALELLPDRHLGSWTQGRWWVPHELDRLGGDTAREDHVQAGGP